VSLVVLVLLARVLLLPWAGALVLKTPLVLLFWAVVVGAATGGLLRWLPGGRSGTSCRYCRSRFC
jgi:hypothetical protein